MSLTPSQSFGTNLRARFHGNSADSLQSAHVDNTHSPRPTRNVNLRNHRGPFSSKIVLFLAGILVSMMIILWLEMPTILERFKSPSHPFRESLPTSRSTLDRVPATSFKKIPLPFPVVDRSILDRLEGLGRSLKKPKPIKDTWPPVVSRVPTAVAASTSVIKASKPPCSQGSCRLLILEKLAEQESKAQIHLSQLLGLAKKLNRTMVLPRVGKSRIGACSRWKFDLYYDLEDLLGRGYDMVSMDTFEGWLEENRQIISSVQRLHFRSMGNPPSDAIRHQYFALFQDPSLSSPPRCLDAAFSSAASVLPTTVIHPNERHHPPIGDDVIGALRQDTPLGFEADVLAVDWNLRYPLLPFSSIPMIEYSPELYHLGEQLAPSSPYLMIHWRMETVTSEVLSDCALSLVNTLSNILNDPIMGAEIKTIWFASDHPMPIGSQNCSLSPGLSLSFPKKSSTFTQLGEGHVEALRIVRDGFCDGGELEGWEVTDLTGALQRASPIPQFSLDVLSDSGVLGILDKIVGVKSAVFVSGSKNCAKKSSYTKQIIELRKTEESKRNLVDYFG